MHSWYLFIDSFIHCAEDLKVFNQRRFSISVNLPSPSHSVADGDLQNLFYVFRSKGNLNKIKKKEAF